MSQSNVVARTGLGRTLWQTGRNAEASRELECALQHAPGSFDALLALVSFQLSIRRETEALSVCERFLQRAPYHSGALGLRTEVGRECKDDRDAHLTDLSRWLSVKDLPADASLHADLGSYSWRIATSWRIRPTTPFPPFPRMPWSASIRRTSASAGGCRRTGACFSRSFRPS